MAAEEEYHIPDEDIPVEQETQEMPEADSSPGFSGGFKYKKIIIIVVVLITLWVGYKIYSSIRGARKVSSQNITTVKQTPEPMKAQPFAQKTEAHDKQSSGVSGGFAPSPSSGLDNRLANIEEGNAEAQTKIERTNASLAELQDSLRTMTSQITALNNAVQDLSGQVSQQQHQLRVWAVMEQEKKIQKSRSASGAPAVAPAKKRYYYIQALIPGRAWLYSGDRTVTVREGDSLSGYGTITGIDTDRSIVTTSSGAIVAFQSDETES